MAESDERFGSMDPKKLRANRKVMQEMSRDMEAIVKAQRQLVNDNKQWADGMKESSGEAGKIAENLSRQLSEQLATTKGQKIVEEGLLKVRQQALDSEIKIFTIKEKIKARIQAEAVATGKKKIALGQEIKFHEKILATEMDRSRVIGTIVSKTEELVAAQDELASNTAFFDNMNDLVKDIPFVSKLLGDLQEAADAARDAARQGNSAWLAAAKSYGNLLGKATLAATGATLVKSFKDMDERQVSFQRNLNMSVDSSFELNQHLIKVKDETGHAAHSALNLSEAIHSINSDLGTTSVTSDDINTSFVLMTKRLGLSAEEATQISKTFIALGKNAKDFNSELIKTVTANNINKNVSIDYKEVMKDINSINNATLLSMNAQGISLGDAAYQARLLGMNMSQLESIADNLLQFESSIEAELEAELLTGRQLNFEKARLYALNNDMVGLARELNAQNITANKFANMNRLQQESIAKSMGMGREEMGKMLITQEALKKIGADSMGDVEKRVRERAKEVGLAKAIEEIGNDELERQMKSATAAELTAQTQQALMESMQKGGAMHTAMEGIKNAIHALNENIDSLKIAMYALSATQMVSSMGGLKGLTNLFKGATAQSGKLLGNMGKIGKVFGTGGTAFTSGKTAMQAVPKGGWGTGAALKRAAGSVGAIGSGVIGGAVAGVDEWMENEAAGIGTGENLGRTATRAGAAGLGAWGGAAAGAAIGTAIFPGIGTTIGGLIGGALGAWGGNFLGDEGGDLIFGEMGTPKGIKLNDFVLEANPNDKIGGVLDNNSVDEMRASLKQLVELQTATVKNTGEVKMELHSYELQ